jgi:LemA protein
MLDSLLARLTVSIEAYPELKAGQNMLALQEELVSTENRIAFARQAYNDAVMRLNTAISVFPSNIVARLFGFASMALFEADASARAAPTVSFGAAAAP